ECESFEIPIGAEQPCAGLGLEQCRGMAGVTERGVEVEPIAVAKEVQRLGEQHGFMTRSHDTAPARRRAARRPMASSGGLARTRRAGTDRADNARVRTRR